MKLTDSGYGAKYRERDCKGVRGVREGKGSMTKHVFILRREVYSGFYVVKFPMFQIYW
jgi:hypothetical protein